MDDFEEEEVSNKSKSSSENNDKSANSTNPDNNSNSNNENNDNNDNKPTEGLPFGDFDKLLHDLLGNLKQEGSDDETVDESNPDIQEAINSFKELDLNEEALEKLVADFEVCCWLGSAYLLQETIAITMKVIPIIIMDYYRFSLHIYNNIIEQSRNGEGYGRNDEQIDFQRCIISPDERNA